MKTYPSKVSSVLVVILFIVCHAVLIPDLLIGNFTAKMPWVALFLSLIFLFVLYLMFTTRYTLNQKNLLIECGPFKYKPIRIDSITLVKKTSNLISAPAASLDRIEVRYGQFNVIMISPKNRDQFIEELLAINPKIENRLKKK